MGGSVKNSGDHSQDCMAGPQHLLLFAHCHRPSPDQAALGLLVPFMTLEVAS